MTQSSASKHSLGILLVEDETVAAIDFECMAEDLGHRVVAAAITPVQARRIMRDLPGEIDLVVFGARLVGLSSRDFSRFLARADVPAIVASRFPEADLRAEGFEEPHLAKPYQASEIAGLLGAVESEVRRAA